MNLETIVQTSHDKFNIEQTVSLKHGDIIETLQRLVIATQEEQVKQALINMGWTPPQTLSAKTEGN